MPNSLQKCLQDPRAKSELSPMSIWLCTTYAGLLMRSQVNSGTDIWLCLHLFTLFFISAHFSLLITNIYTTRFILVGPVDTKNKGNPVRKEWFLLYFDVSAFAREPGMSSGNAAPTSQLAKIEQHTGYVMIMPRSSF